MTSKRIGFAICVHILVLSNKAIEIRGRKFPNREHRRRYTMSEMFQTKTFFEAHFHRLFANLPQEFPKLFATQLFRHRLLQCARVIIWTREKIIGLFQRNPHVVYVHWNFIFVHIFWRSWCAGIYSLVRSCPVSCWSSSTDRVRTRQIGVPRNGFSDCQPLGTFSRRLSSPKHYHHHAPSLRQLYGPAGFPENWTCSSVRVPLKSR